MGVTTVHSLWLAPLCVLLGAAMAWWLYRPGGEGGALSPSKARMLAVLRATAVALIAFFLLEPVVRRWVSEVRRPVVVIARDGSSSLLSAGDTAALRGTYRGELEALAERLAQRYEVRTFTYGEQVREGLRFDQTDGLTDMAQLFREVYDRFAGPDLGAVIVDGDGIINRGRDPLLDATRLGVPVHVIALGDTTVRPDLLVRGVDHNRINYLGNEFPLLVRVEARHLAGTTSRISIMQGDRELAGREIKITGDPWTAETPFTVRADRPGLQRFTVVVRAAAGEANTVNNRQDVFIDVLDDRRKVLLLAASPHPDLGALRLALQGLEGYGTEMAFAGEFTGKVEDFDLVVLHRLPSVKHPVQAVLQRSVATGTPLLFVLGTGSDMAAVNTHNGALRIAGARPGTTDALPVLARGFDGFTLEDDVVRTFERFPPLQVPFAMYEPVPGGTPVFNQRIGAVRTEQPLIAVSRQGARRTGIITGEGLWRWRLATHQQHGDHRRFDLFVHKLVQFLALRVDRDRFRVSHAREFAGNEPVRFAAELYNAALEPVNTPEVSIVLRDGEGRDYPYTFTPAGTGYRLDAGRLPAGSYTWKARTEHDGTVHTADGEFVVRDLLAEQLNTVADHGLLAGIAARTGGLLVRPGSTDQLELAIRDRPEIAARSYTHASLGDLIGRWWILLVILGLLTAEWVMRRRAGTY
jgi:hypothetical protein